MAEQIIKVHDKIVGETETFNSWFDAEENAEERVNAHTSDFLYHREHHCPVKCRININKDKNEIVIERDI
jgi:hypothetical protein